VAEGRVLVVAVAVGAGVKDLLTTGADDGSSAGVPVHPDSPRTATSTISARRISR
jgi:hypothetical protein